MTQVSNEVVWRLPRAQAITIMTLLTNHPYSQVADILHTLQAQLNNPLPQPGTVGSGGAGAGAGAGGGNGST